MDDITTHVGVGPHGELVEVHDPGSNGYVIEKMYAILAVSDDGEGIVGLKTAAGMMPLVAAEVRVIEKMIPVAQQMCNVTQKQMIVVEFTTREIIREINPEVTP